MANIISKTNLTSDEITNSHEGHSDAYLPYNNQNDYTTSENEYINYMDEDTSYRKSYKTEGDVTKKGGKYRGG